MVDGGLSFLFMITPYGCFISFIKRGLREKIENPVVIRFLSDYAVGKGAYFLLRKIRLSAKLGMDAKNESKGETPPPPWSTPAKVPDSRFRKSITAPDLKGG